MSDKSKREDWTKPAAMAIPEGGYFRDKVEQGRYGPIFPKLRRATASPSSRRSFPDGSRSSTSTPRTIEEAVADQPDFLAVLKLHYLRWVLFPINGETYFQYMGIFDTDFNKYTEDAVESSRIRSQHRFRKSRGLSGGLEDEPPGVHQVHRDHERPSFLEYGEYPFVSADEIKKALKLKAGFSNMLDQMQ